MMNDPFYDQILEHKSRKLLSRRDEKLLILDTLQLLRSMTEFFRDEVRDLRIDMGETESLEWDADLGRFVYHRGECSRYLELARREILLRVRPYLQELLKTAREDLRK